MNFGNTSWLGHGFESYISGVKTETPVHQCYLNGVPCWASERYMGGITIEVHSTWHDEQRRRLVREARGST